MKATIDNTSPHSDSGDLSNASTRVILIYFRLELIPRREARSANAAGHGHETIFFCSNIFAPLYPFGCSFISLMSADR